MAWTTPKSWTTGELVTHTLLNTHQRDNLSVTIPNVLTAKGSTAGASGANAMVDRPVGSNGEFLESDSSHASGLGWVSSLLASGAVGLFTTACPTGWTELSGSKGRYIVGMPAGGTNEGTVGTALTDQQNPTHTHTGPSHTHSINRATVLDNNVAGAPPSVTGASGTGATSATSAIMPYIQLRVCEKD